MVLAGVISALEHFLGPESPSTVVPARLAVAGAHIAHMLRDTSDDLRLGYYNIPTEVLSARKLHPDQIDAPAYRAWVKSRANLAQRAIRVGKTHILAARHFRFRMACLVYVLRFEVLLEAIRKGDYEVARSFPSPGKPEAAALLARACLQAMPVVRDLRGSSGNHRRPRRLQPLRQGE
jgi:phytoene/squalene synthetase